MQIHQETVYFLIFIFVGIIYGIIFDFFRALRKVKKRADIVVSIQDIIYFLIVGIILIFTMCIYMKEKLRVYLLLAIILGVGLYISIIGNKIMNLFAKLFKAVNSIISFIFLPLEIFRQIFSKQIKFFKKIANKCCKRFLYMINSNYLKLSQKYKNLIQKREEYAKGRNVKTSQKKEEN